MRVGTFVEQSEMVFCLLGSTQSLKISDEKESINLGRCLTELLLTWLNHKDLKTSCFHRLFLWQLADALLSSFFPNSCSFPSQESLTKRYWACPNPCTFLDPYATLQANLRRTGPNHTIGSVGVHWQVGSAFALAKPLRRTPVSSGLWQLRWEASTA